jgi:hypothetical protein
MIQPVAGHLYERVVNLLPSEVTLDELRPLVPIRQPQTIRLVARVFTLWLRCYLLQGLNREVQQRSRQSFHNLNTAPHTGSAPCVVLA